MNQPREKKCDACQGTMTMSTHCGCFVCESCDNHDGLARCFCGWAADGGNGRRQLEELGETIDPEPEIGGL